MKTGENGAKKAMILSGAGLSAPSGLGTFRGSGGLWENHDVMAVCSVQGFARNPTLVREFFNDRRAQLASVRPNHAHRVIAALKADFGERLFVVTQNIDDLLERAGCGGVIHLHGTLRRLRCTACGGAWDVGYTRQTSELCGVCGRRGLRHDVVMFGEAAPQYATLYAALEQTSLLVCIGTSGQVLPVGDFARWCERSILANLDPDERLGRDFTACYWGCATETIEQVARDVREFLG